ncbi:MAG: 1-acyl-sn-glycerol-3-phosphate acyltransferase [Oscillospiraceae bacterium]|nr:1-acyl-sn-glycerol-3-phosphate acyltransferase [Oscillospiraceae bacterium]
MSKPFAFPWDRVKPYKFYGFEMAFVTVVGHAMYNIKVKGRENLPASASGMILACNHQHSIDPAFLMVATRQRWRFIAKIELFKNKLAATILTHANAFPVDRGNVDRRALDFALAAMAEGSYGLGVFPEGTRSHDGVPKEGKSGVAMIARRTKADVLPCAIYHDGPLKLRNKVTVRVGPVIPFAELGLGEAPNKRQSQAATDQIMAAIRALWQQGHE